MAVGVTGNLSRWYLNLVVFFLDNQYEGKYQNLIDLENRINERSGNNDEDESRSWFPGGVVSYYLNSDKLSEIGLAAGIISNGSGGALSTKKPQISLFTERHYRRSNTFPIIISLNRVAMNTKEKTSSALEP